MPRIVFSVFEEYPRLLNIFYHHVHLAYNHQGLWS